MLFTELEYGVSSYAFKMKPIFQLFSKKDFINSWCYKDDTKEALKRFLS